MWVETWRVGGVIEMSGEIFADVRVLQETRVSIALFRNLKGGPLWFHYDCRAPAEAEIIADATRRYIDAKEADLVMAVAEDVNCRKRCKHCGRFK